MTHSPTERDRALKVKAAHERRLMKIPGVEGVALGDAGGKPAIIVYVSDASAAAIRELPAELEGVPLRVVRSGRVTSQ
jgi:hypothetical protein